MSAKKVWRKLDKPVQDAILFGSGVVDYINRNIDVVPVELTTGILAKFGINRDELNAILAKVATDLNLAKDIKALSLEEVVELVQAYLKTKKGVDWAIASDTIAKVISVFKSPKETKASVILQLIVFAYQTFIKKK